MANEKPVLKRSIKDSRNLNQSQNAMGVKLAQRLRFTIFSNLTSEGTFGYGGPEKIWMSCPSFFKAFESS